MKKKQLFQLSMIVSTLILAVGCAKDVTSVKPSKIVEKESIPQSIVSSDLTLGTLQQSSGISSLTIEATKKEYKVDESIEFKINTNKKTGYLYIIYLDNEGNTQRLYPNDVSPLTEYNGLYTFPKDFGGMTIKATKDCNGCSEDKTTIYALLTKRPVSDIDAITEKNLLDLSGLNSSETTNKDSSSPQLKPKGMTMDLNAGKVNVSSSSHLNVAQIEFVVK